MPFRPISPEVLPALEHKGLEVTVLNHHGYSMPDRGAPPKSRMLYGAIDKKGERHWRSSLEEITQLIDRNFAPSPLSNHDR